MAVIGQRMPHPDDTVLWTETVHGARGRYEPARLVRRSSDGLLELWGPGLSIFDMSDARSLWAALGEALQDAP